MEYGLFKFDSHLIWVPLLLLLKERHKLTKAQLFPQRVM